MFTFLERCLFFEARIGGGGEVGGRLGGALSVLAFGGDQITDDEGVTQIASRIETLTKC
jgi:hypothetical protein